MKNNKKIITPNYKVLLIIFLLFAVILPIIMAFISSLTSSFSLAAETIEFYSSPETGDNLYVIAGLLALAIICAVVLAKIMKKRNKL